jgi:ribonuclease HI
LKVQKGWCSVVAFSDSKCVVNGMTKGWAERRQAKGRKLGDEQDVKNADLWRLPVELRGVEFRWIRGHNRSLENERGDQSSMAASQGKKLAKDLTYETAGQ